MKPFRFLIFLIIPLVLCCNTAPTGHASNKDSLRIDSILKTDAIQFQNALELEIKDPKKAYEKYLTIQQVHSNSYWANLADTRMRFLKARKIQLAFIKKIAGTWEWTWKGTSWGDIEKPIKGKLERKLIMKENGEIEFYENGKLTLADSFEIKSPNEYLADKYLLELKRSRQIFSLHYKGTHLTLTEPNCDCGCMTNEYSRLWRSGI